MKLWQYLSLAALLVIGILAFAYRCTLWFVTREEPRRFSTVSTAALAEFDAGLDDFVRTYTPDAMEHFERAWELDSHFVAPLVYMTQAYLSNDPAAKDLVERLTKIDPRRLNEREKLMVELTISRSKGDQKAQEASIRALAERFPDEPLGALLLCELDWLARDWDRAEACYQKMIERDPQLLTAQLRLGQIAMSRDRFDEAEARFITYRYVAADQAAPHATLGHLYTLLGRYDESAAAFAKALAVKPDYCDAFVGLTRLDLFMGELEAGMKVLEQLSKIPTCDYLESWGYLCRRRALFLQAAGRADDAYELVQTCASRHPFDMTEHRILVTVGQLEQARQMEERLAKSLAESPSLGPEEKAFQESLQHHMAGSRLVAEGRVGEACDAYQKADNGLLLWSGEITAFRLANRAFWLRCLELAGRGDEAERLRAEINALNPKFLDKYDLPRLTSIPPAGSAPG